MEKNFVKKAHTIFALASAKGRGGVQVLRLSGASSVAAVKDMLEDDFPKPRMAALRALRDKKTGGVLDRCVVVFFASPNSYTGEDVVELHLHGGRAVLNAVTNCLLEHQDLRLAEAGEFTRRAFENGKMDLTEAEAVADLVDAETEAQRKLALRQMDGALGRLYTSWADRLRRALAHSEATIDFSDEELPEDLEQKQLGIIRSLETEIHVHLDDDHRGERLREGFTVAILGAPNAGKSSLLNALSLREAAIVSPIEGTTRDVIEVSLDLGGYPVTLADTAGLREKAGEIENEGIKRALSRAASADFKILLFDGTKGSERDEATETLKDKNALCVVNKMDLLGSTSVEGDLMISTKTGDGLQQLIKRLIEEIEKRFDASASPVLTRARHRQALEECRAHLCRAQSAPQIELRAEDLRMAMRSLGTITGKVGVEDLLDMIFRDFCIGK